LLVCHHFSSLFLVVHEIERPQDKYEPLYKVRLGDAILQALRPGHIFDIMKHLPHRIIGQIVLRTF